MIETSTSGSPSIARSTADRNRSSAQIWAEGALAEHPYSLEVRGTPRELSWPRVCAYCGDAASEQITVTKAYRPRPRRHGGRSAGFMRPYHISAAPIPFCGKCAAEHRATVRPPSTASKLASFLFTPLVIPVIGSAWLASLIYGAMRGATGAGALFGWGLLALMVANIVWCTFLMWQTSRVHRLDPQTEITRACDFSEDVSYLYEKERRIYAMRNKTFAEAMASLNRDRVWTEEEQARSMKMSFLSAVLMLAALGGIALLINIVR